jgi:ribosomal protein S1
MPCPGFYVGIAGGRSNEYNSYNVDMINQKNDGRSWDEIKESLKVGTKLQATVTKHLPFGIFVALPETEFTGVVELPDFKDEGDMTGSDYPAVGSSVDVVVLAFKEMGKQIWLSMKPSKLQESDLVGSIDCNNISS